MSKLSPNLAAYLHHVQKADNRTSFGADEVISVDVTYDGDLAPLQAAGMDTGFDRNGVVSGLIRRSRIAELEALPIVIAIRNEREARPLLDKSIPEIRVPWKLNPATPGGRGEGVIVAIIDSGIDITHESFLDGPKSTRILELWDQGATTGGSPPPAGYTASRGRVFNRQQINALLTQRTTELAAGGAITPFPTQDTDGHGTHVAGTAAGNGRQDDRCSNPGTYVGVAPQASLIVVKYIGVTNSSFREAVNWCADARTRLGPPTRPVVINLSLHTTVTNAHDGLEDSALDLNDLLLNAPGTPQPGLAVVCSAGNQGHTNHHESGVVPPNGTTTLPFTIYERDEKFRKKVTRPINPVTDTAWLEVWYDGAATLNVTLIAPANSNVPGSITVGPLAHAAGTQNGTIGGMSVSVFSSTTGFALHGNRKKIAVTISANAGLVLRPGSWRLTLIETSNHAAAFDVWGETSRWDTSFKRDTDTDVDRDRRRANTVGTPAMARSAITVANYESTGRLNASSSWGPFPIPASTPVGEIKPTLSGPGTSIAAPFGNESTDHERNSSCCDQKVVDLTGTSMSAPHITGVVALMFNRNPTLTFEQVRQALQRGTTTADLPAAQVPPVYPNGANPLNIRGNHMWGSGRIDATAAITEVPLPGGGGGGGGTIEIEGAEWGYSPHDIFSRFNELQRHLGNRPGFGLAASLISAHVDETLTLIRTNPKVGAVWQRNGGPVLVRNMLHWCDPLGTLIPLTVDDFSIRYLFRRFLAVLQRSAGDGLRADIGRYGAFASGWPGMDWDELDEAARATMLRR